MTIDSDLLMNDSDKNRHIYVLTGPVQGGKTTSVSALVTLLRSQGVKVGGFLCPGSFSEGRRSAFNLLDIETGQQLPMGSEKEQMGWVKFRRFYFNPDAFIQGEGWIKNSIRSDPGLLVIDEVGPMELEGMGWSMILDTLRNRSSVKQLWIVREQILPEVIHKWKIPDNHIFTIESMESLSQIWMP